MKYVLIMIRNEHLPNPGTSLKLFKKIPQVWQNSENTNIVEY